MHPGLGEEKTRLLVIGTFASHPVRHDRGAAPAPGSVGQLIDIGWGNHYAVGQVIDEREDDGDMGNDAKTDPAAMSGKCRALAMAAYARIASEGFEGLRTRDVAADVGVNIGTLHYYFPSKEALIHAVSGHVLKKFFATLPREGPAGELLQDYLENLRHLLKTDPQLWAVSSEISLRAARDAAMAGTVKGANDTWYEFLRDLIARGVAEGALKDDLDPACVAAALVAAIRGAGLPAAAYRPERIDQTFDQLERWLGLRPAMASDPNQE